MIYVNGKVEVSATFPYIFVDSISPFCLDKEGKVCSDSISKDTNQKIFSIVGV